MHRVKTGFTLQRHPSTAPRAPSFLQGVPLWARISAWSSANLNFYRLHLVAFIVIPLIFSGIFYASNGEHHIAYVDCLFMVVSAITVTGLNSVLLADCTLWQQVILFLMMSIGSSASVSILTIHIRRQFFRRKFEYMVAHSADARSRVNRTATSESQLFPEVFDDSDEELAANSRTTPNGTTQQKEKEKKRGKKQKLRADMVRRVDVPVRINQMNVGGWLSEDGPNNGAPGREGEGNAEKDESEKPKSVVDGKTLDEGFTNSPDVMKGEFEVNQELEEKIAGSGSEITTAMAPADEKPKAPGAAGKLMIQINEPSKPDRGLSLRRNLDHNGAPTASTFTDEPDELAPPSQPYAFNYQNQPTSPTRDSPSTPVVKYFPRSRTIEFRDDEQQDLRLRRNRTHHAGTGFEETNQHPTRRLSHSSLREHNTLHNNPNNPSSFPRQYSLQRANTVHPEDALHSGFGGFPNPITAAAGFAKRKLPGLQKLERNLTMQRTTTLASVHSEKGGGSTAGVKGVSYISFDATVGRNSKFHGLTSAQQEELGGVEYRALTALFRIVAGYWFFSQMICVLILAPWLTYSKYRPVFDDPQYHVNPTWFTFFQVFSAWSNNGMSLVDASMVPFRDAYLLIVLMGFLILGGNTAFPVFLRFVIWTISKLVPSRSRVRETLQFLLDHPRRCFIYLFPSHQTWFLFFVLIVLNSVDWVSFLVLDIGNPEIEQIPKGTRVIDGLLQAFAVRSAGFATVTLANLAPSVQFLYAVMMYIAVYPIAVSIRSTNVYEEKSMGVFAHEDDESEVEAEFEKREKSPTSYIAYHARKQLAFDMWWLVLALWLICVIERHNIIDTETPWINIFTILFEVSSGYGTVGLSLGTPRANTSLSGDLRTLSKLVLCAVMIRGRHRGLPIAIDRAVLLPSDLEKHGDDTIGSMSRDYGETGSRRGSGDRRGLSNLPPQTDAERVHASNRDEEDGPPVGNGEVEQELGSSIESKAPLDG